MSGISPTSRSLKYLRELDYTCQVVEHFNHYSKTRVDLFGVIDIVAVHAEHGILGVQACTTGDAAKREKKAREETRLRDWIIAGGRFEVWGWAKRGPVGKRKLWTLSRRLLTLNDVADEGIHE